MPKNKKCQRGDKIPNVEHSTKRRKQEKKPVRLKSWRAPHNGKGTKDLLTTHACSEKTSSSPPDTPSATSLQTVSKWRHHWTPSPASKSTHHWALKIIQCIHPTSRVTMSSCRDRKLQGVPKISFIQKTSLIEEKSWSSWWNYGSQNYYLLETGQGLALTVSF